MRAVVVAERRSNGREDVRSGEPVGLCAAPPDGDSGGGREGLQRAYQDVRARRQGHGLHSGGREGVSALLRVRDRHAGPQIRGDQGAGRGRQPSRDQRRAEAGRRQGRQVSVHGEESQKVYEEVRAAGERQRGGHLRHLPGRRADRHRGEASSAGA